MPTIHTTRRLLRVYTDKEQWKRDHDEAQSCLDIEEQMAWGVNLYRGLLDLETRVQAHLFEQRDPQGEQFFDLMPLLYQGWTEASEFYLGRALEFVTKGYKVDGLAVFEETVAEARCLVGNLNFEEQVRPIEELVAQARPDNPRPHRYLD